MSKHHVGSPCHGCSGGVLRRVNVNSKRLAQRRLQAQRRRSHYYRWFLRCDRCGKTYSDPSAIVTTQNPDKSAPSPQGPGTRPEEHGHGSKCPKCGGSLLRTNDDPPRVAKRRRRAQHRGSFYFLWQLRCHKCRTYFVDNSARVTPPPLDSDGPAVSTASPSTRHEAKRPPQQQRSQEEVVSAGPACQRCSQPVALKPTDYEATVRNCRGVHLRLNG